MRKMILVVTGALTAVLMLTGCATRQVTASSPAEISTVAAAQVPVTALTSTLSIPSIGITLAPALAADEASVATSAISAISLCNVKGSAGAACYVGVPSIVQQARLTDKNGVDNGLKFTNAPVYVLEWNLTNCSPLVTGGWQGQPVYSGPCTFHSIIDASTGKYIEAFTS